MKRLAVLALLLSAFATELAAQCNTPPLPIPKIAFLSKANEGAIIRYWFTVTNRANFDNALFAASPNLPPCGLNNNASRTWLDIYRDQSVRIYGYCALSNNTQLAKLWFAVPTAQPQPKTFFITLYDRKCHRVVASNVVVLP